MKNKRILLSVIALFLVLGIAVMVYRKDRIKDITWQDLEIVLEYSEKSTSEENDAGLKSVLEDHLGKQIDFQILPFQSSNMMLLT